MSKKEIKVEFANELKPEVFARFIEGVISVNLRNNYSPSQQKELLDKFVEAGFIKG